MNPELTKMDTKEENAQSVHALLPLRTREDDPKRTILNFQIERILASATTNTEKFTKLM